MWLFFGFGGLCRLRKHGSNCPRLAGELKYFCNASVIYEFAGHRGCDTARVNDHGLSYFDDYALGSIEYAAEHLHSHLIVVLGHDKCGAVQATVDGGEAPGHIRSIVEAIQPAVDEAKKKPTGNLLDNAIDENVLEVTERIKHSKPILAHMVEAGELQVVAARYKLDTGEVKILAGP